MYAVAHTTLAARGGKPPQRPIHRLPAPSRPARRDLASSHGHGTNAGRAGPPQRPWDIGYRGHRRHPSFFRQTSVADIPYPTLY